MLDIIIKNITAIVDYVDVNTSCLFYGAQLAASKSSLIVSYFDLLVDLSETFGVWVVLSMITLAAVTALAIIQQIVGLV